MGVRAWLAPVAPLKALAAHRWAKPHLRYFSMRRAAGEQQDLITPLALEDRNLGVGGAQDAGLGV